MLTEIYVEALLIDEALADQIWESWDKGAIDDQVGYFRWCLIAGNRLTSESRYWGGKVLRGR